MRALQSMTLSAATLALLSFSAPLPAFSEMMDMPMNEHREGHGQMMAMGQMDKMGDMMGMCLEHADKLGLSDDQMLKMKPIHNDMKKKQLRFNADLKIAELELMEIMDVKDFDMEKASSAARKIGEIKTAHQLDMLKSMKEMRALLTDEQFKNMKKMMPMKKDGKKPAKRMLKHHK